MKLVKLFSCLVLVASLASVTVAQEKTAEVKRGVMNVVHELTGTVMSNETVELKFDNEQLTDLVVEQVVDHGQKVSADQVLLSLKREDIEKKAHELRQAHRLAELTFRDKQLAAEQAEELNALTRAAKEREVERAEADFRYWEEVTWPQRLEDVQDSFQLAKEYLEDAEEEFNQLKQMYEEDELVEESEKLVLRREERNLRRSRKNFERTEQRHKRTVEVDLPRQEQEYRESNRRNMLRLNKEMETLNDGFEKEAIEMEKAEIAFHKSEENMEKLEAELGSLNLKAPFDGVVYHGAWPASGKTVRVEKDGKVAAKATVLSVSSLEELYLSVNLTEEQLALVETGALGYAIPTAFPKSVVNVRVRNIDPTPSSNKTFDCKLGMQESPAGLLPGMSCKVKLNAYQNDSALLVPDAAVQSDNGSDHFVFVMLLAAADNEPTEEAKEGEEKPAPTVAKPVYKRVDVKTGVSFGGKTEILSGLKEGDKVLLGRPEA